MGQTNKIGGKKEQKKLYTPRKPKMKLGPGIYAQMNRQPPNYIPYNDNQVYGGPESRWNRVGDHMSAGFIMFDVSPQKFNIKRAEIGLIEDITIDCIDLGDSNPRAVFNLDLIKSVFADLFKKEQEARRKVKIYPSEAAVKMIDQAIMKEMKEYAKSQNTI